LSIAVGLSCEKERLSTATDFFVAGLGDRATQVERRTARRRWVRWLVPDVALVASLFTLFYCLIPFHAPRELFRDADTGWHIITGQKILDQGRFPETDPYSFVRAGAPWFAWDWGADCIMGEIERQAGLTGVTWMFAFAIAAVTWFWFRLNWAVNGNLVLACLMFPVMLAAASRQWTAAPHIAGWIMMLISLRFLEDSGAHDRETPREGVFAFRLKDALLFGLSAALWANLQASFWFLPAAAVLYGLSHLLRPLIWNLDRQAEWRLARWYAWAAAFAVAGSLMNPYGMRPYGHAIESLVNAGHFPQAAGGSALFAATVIATIGGVLAIGQKKLAHFLLMLLLLAAALGPAQMFGVPAIVLLPLANGSITDALRRAHDLRPRVRASIHAALLYSDRLRLVDGRLRGWWLAMAAAVVAFLWLLIPSIDAHTGFAPDRFPVYAAGELGGLPANARLLTPATYSGYIIYRYRGERRIFLDGRSELYGKPLVDRYNHLMEVRPGWQQEISAFGVTHALLPRDHPLTAALEQAGWRIQFRDDTAALFVNPLADGARQ
jgi:hypothetical protein